MLVDGSSYLYRAFHALPDLRTKKGEPTGALRGVLAMLKKLVEDEKPDRFAVVFDAPGRTFRDAWYAEYKANRTPMPDDLALQIEPLHALVRANGWPLLMIAGVEADDVIGTLAHEARDSGMDVIVSTSDKDLAQLVGPHVVLVNTMSNETLDEAGVLAKFGVRADQVLDLLTLTGDAIDNVPGVPKVGPKTAAKWLVQYGTLDDVLAHANEIPGVVGENLRQTRDWLPQGRRLLTVQTDCELTVKVIDLAPREPDVEVLKSMYDRYEFKQWLKEVAQGNAADTGNPRGAGPETTAEAAAPVAVPERPRGDYETILDADGFERVWSEVTQAELVSFDTQTTTREPMQFEIVGLAFSTQEGRGAYVPLAHRYPGAPSQLDRDQVLARVRGWFGDPQRLKVGQNVKHDEHALANHGIELRGVAHDTLIESYVLESHRQHDVHNLAWRQLNLDTVVYDDVTGKGAKRIGFEDVSVERGTEYAAQDVDVTLRLHRHLWPRIEGDEKLRYVYERIELPVREVLFRMERSGVLVDAALLAKQSHELGERILKLEQQAFAEAGQPFNLGSPKQLCEILFERMKLPVVKKTATGQPSTDEEVLQELAADFPLPRLILEHRGLCKLKTYTDRLPQMVNPRTGRVHTTLSQITAVTGRLASTDPNLQNIPVRTAEGRRIREAFVAAPGNVVVSADYSQIELRIMAHLSGDPALLAAFREGSDIHRATAAEIFGVSPADVTSQQRSYIKAVNFGLIYGMSAFGLAAQLNIERSAAQQFIDKYFTRYPGVAEYMRRTRDLARAQGFVETVFGRRLWLPDIKAAGGPRRAGAERAAIHAPMQGTAADLIKMAMIAVQAWLDRETLRTRLILQVHDELVLEVPEGELSRVKDELPRLMTGVAELRVPLVVDVGAGANWDRAH